MSLDHEAIFKAYPDCVSSDDGEGAFKADGTKITINQSLVDAARVELNKLNYQQDRVVGSGTTLGYPKMSVQLDQLWHDINDGKFGSDAKSGSWFVGISSIKTIFPKP